MRTTGWLLLQEPVVRDRLGNRSFVCNSQLRNPSIWLDCFQLRHEVNTASAQVKASIQQQHTHNIYIYFVNKSDRALECVVTINESANKHRTQKRTANRHDQGFLQRQTFVQHQPFLLLQCKRNQVSKKKPTKNV